jgi:hypothetical protein
VYLTTQELVKGLIANLVVISNVIFVETALIASYVIPAHIPVVSNVNPFFDCLK